MNLFRAEFRRLSKRAVTRWTLLVVLGVLAVAVAGTWFTNHKPGPDVLALAEQRAYAEYEEQKRWWEENLDYEIAACERSQQTGDGFWPDDFDCASLADQGPRPEDFSAEWYLPPTFEFRYEFSAMITVFVALLALYAFVVGASFVGAEWRTGGMMNLLLWQPRRLRVLLAKLVVLLLSLLGIGLVLGAAWTGVMWLVATFRGITETTTAEVWGSFGLNWLRGLVLVLVTGLIGFTAASIGRHTALAMGVATGAVVIGVPGALIGAQIAGADYPEAWVWPTYVIAWMDKSVTLRNWNACNYGVGGCEPAEWVVTWQTSGIAMGVLAVVLVAAAMWRMARRDIAG
ncbi:MAG TPA: ABC transporter permease subunit [Natronosporangium sp.]|nr:ABC transporter permease subunit [Natronosporangium sp.]